MLRTEIQSKKKLSELTDESVIPRRCSETKFEWRRKGTQTNEKKTNAHEATRHEVQKEK